MSEAVPIVNAYLQNDYSITLLSRDARGRRVVRRVPAEWVAYFKAADLDEKLYRDLRSSAHVRGIRRDGEWVRVSFVNRIARQDFCEGRRSFVAQLGLQTYEADVDPVLRYVIDNDVQIAKPKRVWLDFETDSRIPFSKKEEMRVLVWTLEDEDGRVQVGVLDEDTDCCEKALLTRLWEVLENYDQVLAWNGDEFDFAVLFARSEDRGCPVVADRWLWLDHMVLFRRMNLNASESGDEKQSMRLNDIAQAELGEGKEETPPEVIAKFGDKPLGALSWQLWEAGGVWRQILVRYCLRDTNLLKRIEKATGYIALFDTLCEVCHIFAHSASLNPTHQMDGFMLRLGLERGHHFVSKRYFEGSEKFKGAYVMHPLSVPGDETGDEKWSEEDATTWRADMGMKNGILRNVHVADFASLYPSIIITWNMSPDTKVVKPEGRDRVCVSPLTKIVFDTSTRGILPDAVDTLLKLRKKYAELQASFPPGTDEHQEAKRKSNAYKVAANSFYGVMGSPFSRYFDRNVAESVTQNAVWLIQHTKQSAEQNEMTVCYADTDSIFVIGASRDEFANFVAWCNSSLYPDIVTDLGCVENRIKLAYEKAFDRLIFTSAKKYVGNFLHYKGKDAVAGSKPEIKGLEWKRGDAVRIARQLQGEVIELLVGGMREELQEKFGEVLIGNTPTPTEDLEPYHLLIGKMRSHILNDALALSEIRTAKSLSKPLKEYAQKIKKDGTPAAQPPHVAMAKILQRRGEEVTEGTRIEYIVTDGSCSPMKVIPAGDYTGTEADRYYIWEDQVFPAARRLLDAAFPNNIQDWERWHKVRPKKERVKREKKTKMLPQNTA